uniref:Ig-like domain-containing protein n=1 Tax=Heterorhabditis bacteriophora TaxID=37862 RepID=A0A1I7X1T1_HETBA
MQKAPIFQSELKDKTGLAGQDLSLKCQVLGYPEPQIVWAKDGERLTTSRRVKLSFEEGGWCHLNILGCTSEDTGLYLCSATNVVGVTGSDSHLIIADIIEDKKILQSKPRFIRAPASTIEVQEGGQFKLIAKATGDPKPIVTWKKEGRDILRTNRLYKSYVTGDGESHLIVECVVSKTSGIFSCFAQNTHGEVEVIVQRTKTVPVITEAPIFTQNLKDMGVVTGHPVTLSCKEKFVVILNMSILINKIFKSTELLFKANNFSYLCHLLFSKFVSTELSDEPAGPPRFIRCLRDIWTPLEQSIIFDVEVTGYPIPDLCWYHNDKKITEGKNIEIIYKSETICELHLSDLTLNDLGSYAVEASNVHGLVRTTGSLNQKIATPEIAVQAKVAFKEQRHRHRHSRSSRTDAHGLAESILAGMAIEEEKRQSSEQESKHDNLGEKHINFLFILKSQQLIIIELKYVITTNIFNKEEFFFKFCSIRNNLHRKGASSIKVQCIFQMSLDVDAGDSVFADGIPPQFRTDKIRHIIRAMDGERVELVAEIVQGSEPLQIRWLRNKMVIMDSSSFQYSRTGEFVKLIVADAFPEDGGEYAVEAKNQWGVARCIMRLDINMSLMYTNFIYYTMCFIIIEYFPFVVTTRNPAFETTKILSWHTVTLSRSPTFFSSFYNYITFRRNAHKKTIKQFIASVGGIAISNTDDSSTLSIVFLENSHVGEYLCAIRNPYGEDLATSMILIEGTNTYMYKSFGNRINSIIPL